MTHSSWSACALLRYGRTTVRPFPLCIRDNPRRVLPRRIVRPGPSCLSGIPLPNIAWFVLDKGLPEAEEVAFLVERQQHRHTTFWERVDRGEAVHPSDGKRVPDDKIKFFVQRLRGTYFRDGALLPFTDDWIVGQVQAFKSREAKVPHRETGAASAPASSAAVREPATSPAAPAAVPRLSVPEPVAVPAVPRLSVPDKAPSVPGQTERCSCDCRRCARVCVCPVGLLKMRSNPR